MITPVLDLLLDSKRKVEASQLAFDAMLTESLKMLFLIAGETDPRALDAWHLASENGGAVIFDLRKRRWGKTSAGDIYYMKEGSAVRVGGQALLWFCREGVEAFYFDDDDDRGRGGNCGWCLFSEDKQISKQEEDEDEAKEENGNLH